MLQIQKFLKDSSDIETGNLLLEIELGIKIKKYTQYSEKSLYHYTYTPESKNHPITNEANAIVLDEDANLVSHTFKKIQDVFEPNSIDINWTHAPIAEYIEDGILVKIDKYLDQMLITTRNGIGGDEKLSGTNSPILEFALSRYLYDVKNDPKPLNLFYSKFSYVFQFVYPAIYTTYKRPYLILLAIMNKTDGSEINRIFVNNWAEEKGFYRPVFNKICGFNDIHNIMSNLKENDKGIIVNDLSSSRIIFRNKKFIDPLKSSINGKVDLNKFVKLIFNGKDTEVIYNFPKYAIMLNLLRRCLTKAKHTLESFWQENKHLDSSSFFNISKLHPLYYILNKRYNGKIESFNKIERQISSRKLLELTSQYFPDEFDKAYKILERSLKEKEKV